MDRATMLTAFEQQIRRNPHPGTDGYTVEHDRDVVRLLSNDESGWAGVTWSELDEQSADRAIAEQIQRFASRRSWEWKYYDYDAPTNLPERLLAAGFEREEDETVLVAETRELLEAISAMAPPEGVELREVRDPASVHELVELQEEVFGSGGAQREQAMHAGIAQQPSTVAALMASAGGKAVAGGRVEFYPGTDFAGIWGTCTHPRWERRGIFRALVAHATALIAARGFRYVQLDAAPESRPILVRLGFEEVAKTTPFIYGEAQD